MRVMARGEHPGIPLVRGDIADADAVARAVEGCDTVFHVAAKAGVWGRREDFVSANVTGTENVIAACRAAGVTKLVYTSSPSVVFDERDHLDASELPYPATFLAHYPETKAIAERAVLAANSSTLATLALRPHLIWGPRDPHLFPRLIARARAGRLRIIGDGTNRVSITYVENGAAAHLQAAAALTPGAACAGRAYFVNDPEPIVLWEWLNGVFGRLGIPPVTRKVSAGLARAAGGLAEAIWSLGLSGEPPLTRFVASQMATSHTYDIGPAVRDFGYAPVVGASEAMEATIGWFGR